MTDAELTVLLDASHDENRKMVDDWTEYMRVFQEKSDAITAYRKKLFAARNKLRGYPPPQQS